MVPQLTAAGEFFEEIAYGCKAGIVVLYVDR